MVMKMFNSHLSDIYPILYWLYCCVITIKLYHVSDVIRGQMELHEIWPLYLTTAFNTRRINWCIPSVHHCHAHYDLHTYPNMMHDTLLDINGMAHKVWISGALFFYENISSNYLSFLYSTYITFTRVKAKEVYITCILTHIMNICKSS